MEKFSVEQLKTHLLAASAAGPPLAQITAEDFFGITDEATVSTAIELGGKRLELWYGQTGECLTLWLGAGERRVGAADVRAALRRFQKTELGGLLMTESLLDGSLLFVYTFPMEEGKIVERLRRVFTLAQDAVSGKEFVSLLDCFS